MSDKRDPRINNRPTNEEKNSDEDESSDNEDSSSLDENPGTQIILINNCETLCAFYKQNAFFKPIDFKTKQWLM